MSNYLKTKADALKAFKESSNNYPLWTIYELGKRNPIFSNMTEGDESKTIKLFEGNLADLYPEKIYTVKMFKNLLHRKGGQKFIIPNCEFAFQFERTEAQVPLVNGIAPAAMAAAPVIAPYGVDHRQQIGLSDHIQLITAKAKAESDCEYYKAKVSDQARMIADLEKEIADLEADLDDAEEEIKELEENKNADEKEKAIKGTGENTMEGALAKVIGEHGGTLLENMFSKGVKGAPDFKEEQLNGEEVEKDNQTVNGLPPGVNLMEVSITTLHEEMLSINPKWKRHLVKLILIGQQKPITFKMFMKKLEEF